MNRKELNQRMNYDQVAFRIPKGNKTILQLEAAKREKTVNDLIIDAIETQYSIDLRKKTEK